MQLDTISIPGRVWDDFLNSDVSEMEHDLGLPKSSRVRRGRGFRAIYRNVPLGVAEELSGYLRDRGDTLLGQSISDPYDPFEKSARDTYRAAIKSADEISGLVQREKRKAQMFSEVQT